jgi:uncharacterized membrane protein YfcA
LQRLITAALRLAASVERHARCLPKLNTERKNCTPMTAAAGLRQMIVPTVAIGFVVGIAGGLIGLGGAELRLPYVVGVLLLAPRAAVPVNFAVSLITVLASLPVRLSSVEATVLIPWLPVVLATTGGALLAAYVGAGRLRRLPTAALARIIGALQPRFPGRLAVPGRPRRGW